jgi:hypothetical protein
MDLFNITLNATNPAFAILSDGICPAETPTPTPTVTDTPDVTVTPTPTISETPTSTPTPTVTDTPDPTVTPTISETPTSTPTPTITPTTPADGWIFQYSDGEPVSSPLCESQGQTAFYSLVSFLSTYNPNITGEIKAFVFNMIDGDGTDYTTQFQNKVNNQGLIRIYQGSNEVVFISNSAYSIDSGKFFIQYTAPETLEQISPMSADFDGREPIFIDFNPTPTPTSTPTATITPTNTPTASGTPIPSVTPTNTPSPSDITNLVLRVTNNSETFTLNAVVLGSNILSGPSVGPGQTGNYTLDPVFWGTDTIRFQYSIPAEGIPQSNINVVDSNSNITCLALARIAGNWSTEINGFVLNGTNISEATITDGFCVTPTPTPTISKTPTSTPTPTVTPTISETPTSTPTPTVSETPTSTPTPTPTESEVSVFNLTMLEVGPNVVFSGSGTFNLTGLTFKNENGFTGGYNAANGTFYIGNWDLPGSLVDYYTGTTFNTFPTSFGSGSGQPNASSDYPSTIPFTLDALYFGQRALGVPSGYVSGQFISASNTYTNKTLLSMGLTPGTYLYSWGTGIINLQIGV